MALDENVKTEVKSSLLATLGTSAQDVAQTAALAVAKVAAIEIPRDRWKELIPSLLSNAQTSTPTNIRQVTLQTLGYVCEELGKIEGDFMDQDTVNAVLTSVVSGMRPEEANRDIKIAATKALDNALEFASNNFSNEAERNYIMQVLCQETLAEDPRVQQIAWECLISIAELYYAVLPSYMSSIFELTQRSLQSDEAEVSLQALEFWLGIAEIEINIDERKEEETDNPDLVNHNFIKTALQQLVPLLLQQLTRQEEGAEENEAWNIALAAGTALGLAAVDVGDPIVELVMPFVQENIQRNNSPEDWRLREAATFAFGSILEGPQVTTLGPLASSGLGFLLNALKDPHPQVKNTTAWTIGRIFEFVHGDPDLRPPLLNEQSTRPVVEALLAAISDEVHVAEKACYAIGQLAAGFNGMEHSPLDPYFKDIVAALLGASARSVDAVDAMLLQAQAFEAINEIVGASSAEAIPLVAQLIPVVTGKILEAVNVPPVAGEVADRAVDQQGLLCGVIQVTVQKLTSGDENAQSMLKPQADTIMDALLRVLNWRTGTISEEALLAIGTMTYACGRGFKKYMEAFFPSLLRALQEYADYQTCQVAVGIVGDLCRALEEDVFEYGDRLMLALLSNLQSDEVDRSIKPQILASFGDLALAIGDRFEVYLVHVIQMLQSAAQLCMELATKAVEEEEVSYVNRLRQGILEAWAGMLNGMTKAKSDQYLRQYAFHLIELAESVASDAGKADSSTLRAAIALIGDVASSLQGAGSLFLQKPGIKHFLQQYAIKEGSLGETANWALHSVITAERSVSLA